MKLTEKQKEQIKTEYHNWFESAYGNKSLEERRELDAFFTPPELTIQMIERFESIENKTILDPTCGTGNLLAACVIAGADPKKVFGNELDEEFTNLCKKRLSKLGVPEENIHQGDALRSDAYHLPNGDHISALDPRSFTREAKTGPIERKGLFQII